jgi:uncharacterized protein (DUF58 family)
MGIDHKSIVDPAFFSRLDNLELRAKSIVEGFMQGTHRSPFVGYSVEFASHREYVPGDDLRHVNWKLYARQKRLYVKEYDAETNMNLYIYLDVSGSMECASNGLSKLNYGASLAAALSHLALKQRDAVGLTLYADEILGHLPPKSTPHYLQELLQLIASTSARPVSDARRALPPAVELAKHRGMVVIISDFFDDTEAIIQAIDNLRFRRHEVILFHILDPWERELPDDGVIRFQDMETGEEIVTRTEGIREEYLEAIGKWRDEIEEECLNRSVDRVEVTTEDSLEKALVDYLSKRFKVGP